MLIATDLDGTLVPNGDTAPTRYCADVLERLDQASIQVVFVTGRPLRWMTDFWPHVDRAGVAIVSNGAITYDVHAGEVIDFAGLEPAPGLELVAGLTEAVPGVTFAIECRDGIRRDTAYVDGHRVPEGSPCGALEDIWDVPALKLLARHTEMDPVDFRDRAIAAIGDQATPTWSIPGLLEISASGVTKASALVTLCKRFGVHSQDVVAFGDMPNDIAMLRWAGTAYAMEGAHDSVCAVADHIAPRCEDDGVARVLDHLLLGH